MIHARMIQLLLECMASWFLTTETQGSRRGSQTKTNLCASLCRLPTSVVKRSVPHTQEKYLVRGRHKLAATGLVVVTLVTNAALSRQVYAQDSSVIEKRIAYGMAKSSNASPVTIPEGVSLADGLTEDEAVAIALWNNATFNADLAALGFARADLREAGLLSNPILSLLFPLGPKQFEATLNLPIEILWQRPRRVAIAKVNMRRVAESLEQNALNLVRDVRLAYADAMFAEDQARLAANSLQRREQIPTIMEARLRAGDISELEANAARVEWRTAEEEAARLAGEVGIVKERLRFLLGLSEAQTAFEITPPTTVPSVPTNADTLLKSAFAARPDLRAAELAIEVAAERAKWERSRIFTLLAGLDINGQGTKGFEAGPGIAIEAPIFNRNQGGISRAEAEVELAMRQYAVTRQLIALEVKEARAQLAQAQEARAHWRERILPALEEDVRIWEASYRDGEVPYLFVLQNTQRLDTARLREAEVHRNLRRAQVQLDRSIGRSLSDKQ